MKKIVFFILIISGFLVCCNNGKTITETIDLEVESKRDINDILDKWHAAASKADYNTYINYMAADAQYIGTDANENWPCDSFKNFAKPYFDKGKAWSFKPLQRNVYIAEGASFAWFDELLATQMKICRGSGVMALDIKGNWKIKQYVLSMTIPNAHTKAVVAIKTPAEDSVMKTLIKK